MATSGRLRRWHISGIVMLIWFSGAIIGGAGTWYIAEQSTSDLRHDHNALICVLRSIVIPAQARSVQTAADTTQSASARARARNAVMTDGIVLNSLLTIPRNFDCKTLSTTVKS